MAIHSVINQFLGINPLLHSQFQEEGGWDNFHVNHISDLTRYLQRELRPLGYLARAEQSLQIRRNSERLRSPESDVTIYDTERRVSSPIVNVSGGLAMPVPELLELDETDLATYRAIGIYEKANDSANNDAVAWLELLSPANKSGGRHAKTYRDKRTALLQAGLVFIELDYLHQQAPTVAAPIYPEQNDSSCYRIVLIDPRPTWLDGQGSIYPIHVDQKLPTVDIPLNAGDTIRFNFDAPYQQTYENLFFGDAVDYARLPLHWDSYSQDDQARILSRLLSIRSIGNALEKSPQTIPTRSLNEALSQWES